MRQYQHFAELCMPLRPTARWVHDLQRQHSEPAMFVYLVNTTCKVLFDRPALDVSFIRTDAADGYLTVGPGPAGEHHFAAAPVVLLVADFYARRLTDENGWISNMKDVVLSSCPEISAAQIGETLQPRGAGAWLTKMLGEGWIPVPAQNRSPVSVEPSHAP